ncbi:MAG: hypothetical protein RL094_76 [Candidatus Parcubacteria bacterium]
MNKIKTVLTKALSGAYGSIVLLITIPIIGILIGTIGYYGFINIPENILSGMFSGIGAIILLAGIVIVGALILGTLKALLEARRSKIVGLLLFLIGVGAIYFAFAQLGAVAGLLTIIAIILLLILFK